MKYIIKRDGQTEGFNRHKIVNAIIKAFIAVGEDPGNIAEMIAQEIEDSILEEEYALIEDVQDLVEQRLTEEAYTAGKAYILYRDERNKTRNSKSKLKFAFDEIFLSDNEVSDIKRENGNIDGNTPMAMMLRAGSEASKDYYLDYISSKKLSDFHRNGDFHIHDLDFAATGTLTCVQIPFGKVLKDGFNSTDGFIREPKTIHAALSLAAIIFQSSQNNFHGGQSAASFDYDMAPYVKKSFAKYFVFEIDNFLKYRFNRHNHIIPSSIKDEINRFTFERIPLHEFEEGTSKVVKTSFFESIKDEFDYIIGIIAGTIGSSLETEKQIVEWINLVTDELKYSLEDCYLSAIASTIKETHQACEAFIYNMNHMHSRGGGQCVFSSINYGLCQLPEAKLFVKQLLRITYEGLGNGETAKFPVQIFKLKAGVNLYKGDPNYSLFQEALKTTAKRLFPNFSFMDAPFNKQYYKADDINTHVAYMGCVQENEVITYRNLATGEVRTEAIRRLFDSTRVEQTLSNLTDPLYNPLYNYEVYDTNTWAGLPGWTKIKGIIRNPSAYNNLWCKVAFDNRTFFICTTDHPLDVIDKGRVEAKDLVAGDKIRATFCEPKLINSPMHPFVEYENPADDGFSFFQFQGNPNNRNRIAQKYFNTTVLNRLKFLGAVIDNMGKLIFDDERLSPGIVNLSFKYKEPAYQIIALFTSLGYVTKLVMTEDLLLRTTVYDMYVILDDKLKESFNFEKISISSSLSLPGDEFEIIYPAVLDSYTVVESVPINTISGYSYDLETESGTFNISNIHSYNCRTRVIGNAYDPTQEIVNGRGNCSYTTVNLPRLAFLAKNTDEFFNSLHELLECISEQLLERFKFQTNKQIINFPFAFAGIWMDSEKYNPTDTIGNLIKHGTLSIGFIGLAETLVALTGKHHGESEESQQLGLKIIQYMKDFCDRKTELLHLNFTLLATPAENLCYRFAKIDQKKFGKMIGITDKDYYTNSFHIPVKFNICAAKKISLEAPYHALTNAGHITYIELDGDTSNNIEAMESIIQYMQKSGIGYGAINHPVDRDPFCGYVGIINDRCPKCGRKEHGLPTKAEYIDNFIEKYKLDEGDIEYLKD
jgi:anaerobic ribonucleoside-triphosphate reductase